MSRITEYLSGFTAATAPLWGSGTARAFQSARLRAMVRHAWREVPVYRRLWEQAGVDPDSIRGMDDLHRLPVIGRNQLRDGAEAEVVARSRRRQALKIRRTSGSTGAPLTIRRSTFEDLLLRGFRFQGEWGYGDYPWGSRFSVVGLGAAKDWRKRRAAKVTRVDCLEPMPKIVEQLLAAQPAIVGGYSGSVAALAAAVPPEARSRLNVQKVFCGAETLTPGMRQVIHEAFGVPPLTLYASHEFNMIATECRVSGLMHVAHGSVIVEILRDGQPAREGEQGEVVVTGLHSFAMPFIRYRLGDLATQGPARCPCGASNPVLGEVQGRILPPFLLPGGRTMHPYAIIRPLLASGIVRQYEIVQEEIGLIRVRVVPLSSASVDHALRTALETACGPGVRLELESVNHLELGPTRKFMPCRTLVGGS